MPNAITRLVHRADVALSCYDEGAGPPVVFLASWSLPGASWRRQVEAFCAAGLRCITYDRRGHGHTPDPGHGYDFDTLADDLAAVLDAFDLHGVTLVTFSAGSGEAVRYLTRHGDARIARLAMIAPTTPLLVRRDDHPDGVDPAMFEAFIETELRPDWRGWLDRNARPFGGPDVAQSELDEVIAQALQASPYALEAFYRELTTRGHAGRTSGTAPARAGGAGRTRHVLAAPPHRPSDRSAGAGRALDRLHGRAARLAV